MKARKADAARVTGMITLVVLLSKALGFARDMISAGYFSTGMARDAYASAYSLFYLPVLLLNSCITSTVVPLYIETRGNIGRRAANRFASNCVNLAVFASLLVGLIMMLFSQPLVRLIYGGFAAVPGKLELTSELVRIMLPSLAFVAVSIVLSSLLNANERYLPAQLTGFPLSIAVIAATVVFSPRYGIQAVAWGVFAAGILQMLVLVPSASHILRYSPRTSPADGQVKRLLLLSVPAMLSMAVNELNHMIDKSIASYLVPGDIAAMDYAYRLIQFATGVLAVPITTVMFSRIARRASSGDKQGVCDVLGQSVETLVMVILPIMAVGCALSGDVIRVAYKHGAFGEDAVAVTSGVFFYYLLGILGFSLRDAYNRAFHGMQDTRTPLRVSYLTVALNIGLNVLFSRFMGANGLALATTLSCAIGAAVLAILFRRRLGASVGFRRLVAELVKMLAGAALCLVVTILLDRLLPGAVGKLPVLLRLAGIAALSAIVYLGVLAALRVRALAPFLHKRRKAS